MMENTHALIIGIGQRPQGDSTAMAITAQDAQKISDELQKRVKIPQNNITCLSKEQTSKQGILNALDNLIARTATKAADMVWVYFSGHGYRSKEAKHYLICHDTTEADWQTTALAGSDFVAKLQQIKAGKMLLLLDCCHAGGITADELEQTAIPFDPESLLKTQPNRVVLTASHAQQTSLTSTPVSLFTFALVEGLAGTYLQADEKDIKFFDLAMYVRERVYPLSKRKQQPQLNVLEESSTKNFVLLHYPEGKPSGRAFDEAFQLLDETKSLINLDEPTETDTTYRQQFQWLMRNEVKIDGNHNVVTAINGQNITINQNTSDEKLLEILAAQQVQNAELIAMLKNAQEKEAQSLGQRLENLLKKEDNPIKTTIEELRNLAQQGDLQNLLDKLDALFEKKPHFSYSNIRQNLQFSLTSGMGIPPHQMQGLLVFLGSNEVKKRLSEL